MRHVFLMAGCFPADRESITAGLQQRSLGFLPEGIAGIFNGANRCALQGTWILVPTACEVRPIA